MPELPDVLLYQTALQRKLVGHALQDVIVRSPFLLRTWEHQPAALVGLKIESVERLGKRLVWCFEKNLFVVIHLMIAGRFHWKNKTALPTGKNDLAAFQFESGSMMLTEASSKKRAGMWIIVGRESVSALHKPGLDPLRCELEDFNAALQCRNNTLKRALTDPSRFDGIGNAYSDEILFAARLSPLQRTENLTLDEVERLWRSCRNTMTWWIELLQAQHAADFPERVTAFRPEMKVHGKFGKECSECRAPIQRIRYADNERNYCARCQTEGRILADRSLSRLLKDDWPKTLEELE
jgi:formamidopyrimidine-DNA glycosylase